MTNKFYNVAYSSHRRCFICKRKAGSTHRLGSIKQQSVIYGFKKHHIVIKYHARCCRGLFDLYGYINPSEFEKIKTKKLLENRT
jgi:hypothetical protein